MSRKSNLYILICIFVMVTALSVGGCQLAKNGGNEGEIFGDNFIGVYVTLSPINVVSDGLFETKSVENEKVYATKVEVKEEDSDHITYEYRFEDIEGIPMYQIYVDDGEGYHHFMANEYVFNAHQSLNYKDEATFNKLTGDVYFSEKVIVYLNPVYQENDGDVYMVAADTGCAISGLGEWKLYHSDEDSIKGGMTVEILFKLKGEVEKVSFIAMSSENEIVWSKTYLQGEVPEVINVPKGTEYITVKTEFKGEREPEFKVFTSNEKFTQLLKNGNGKVLEARNVEFRWE